MRIRCSTVILPPELRASGLAQFPNLWPVDLNAEYLVFALSQQDGLWWAIFEHHEREIPVTAPLALFEVIDPTASSCWNVRVKNNEASFHPSEMDDAFFCDDVQERRGDALDRYRAMKARFIVSE